jgi:hypothetical protein
VNLNRASDHEPDPSSVELAGERLGGRRSVDQIGRAATLGGMSRVRETVQRAVRKLGAADVRVGEAPPAT